MATGTELAAMVRDAALRAASHHEDLNYAAFFCCGAKRE
jgi:hypothetical protein